MSGSGEGGGPARADCPFYAHAFHKILTGDWVFVPNSRSNQCALITTARAPCMMEVWEHRSPEWSLCSLNPSRPK